MKIFTTVCELLDSRKNNSLKTGFIPTMGALHEGHLSLIQTSKKENSCTGCSIFVNPIQFNNPEDFNKYPITREKDLELLESVGCDWVFVPSVEEMYPKPSTLKFNFGFLETVMEGAFRPGHFNGVAIVVSKLLHAANPDVVYFGRKDLQQTVVISQLILDLGFRQEIRIIDTIREQDGLAMSSRNVRLNPEERIKSTAIYRTLKSVQESITKGENISVALQSGISQIKAIPEFNLEYLEIVDSNTLQKVDNHFTGHIAVCIAVQVGKVRLIDNVVFFKN